MAASNSTQEIDAPGRAPDTRVVRRPSDTAAQRRAAPAPAPARQAKSPKAAAATAPAAEEAKPAAEARPRGRFALLFATPSWLVSMAVHTVGVIILALLTVPPVLKSVGTFLEATDATSEVVEDLQPLKVEVVELKKTEMTSADVSAEAVASVSVADAGQLGAVAANLSVGDVEVPAQAEIDGLFAGDSGKAMGSAVGGDAKAAAQFFGVKATGRRFVFIVDSSNSMKGGKFAAAKEELMYAIRRLSKDQSFYIIFFDANAERMLLPPDKEPPLLPAPATTDNILRAEKWVNTVQNELKTNPYDSVKFAIEMVPDAIYLLTDGKFTDRGQTERYLKANNLSNDPVDGYRPKVVIHTICFWQKDGEDTLKAIAKDYGGTYRFVPPGKK